MTTVRTAGKRGARGQVIDDLQWEAEERVARRSAGRGPGRRNVNLTSEIERYLNELY